MKRKNSRKSLRSIKQWSKEKYVNKKSNDVGYVSLTSATARFKKDVKYYQTQQLQNQEESNSRNWHAMQSTDESSLYQKSDGDNTQMQQLRCMDSNKDIIKSLNKLNKRSTETRNNQNEGLIRPDSDFDRAMHTNSYFTSLRAIPQNHGNEVVSVSRKDINDLWVAIEYQDRTIHKLISENAKLSNQVKDLEAKLNSKVKDVQKNISDINSNFENLLPIIEDMTEKYRKVKKPSPKSRSPCTIQKPVKRPDSRKVKSTLKSRKYASKQAVSSKLDVVKPEQDGVSVINCNLLASGDFSDIAALTRNGVVERTRTTNPEAKRRQRPVYFKSTLDSHNKIQKLSLLKRKPRTE